MTKRKRILLIIIGIVLIALLILSFYANSIIKNKIETLLKEKIPEHIELLYKDIAVQSLTGTISIEEPNVLIRVKDSKLIQTQLTMKKLVVGNVSYWDYLINGQIHVGNIEFKDLETIYFKNRLTQLKDTASTKKENKLLNSIKIDKLNIENASAIVYDETKDSLLVSLKNTTILIQDIALNESSKSNLIPFKYKTIKMEADSIFYKTSIYENINLKHLLFEDQKLTLHGFHYKNKYSKKEYEKLLIIQRDYYDVTVEKLIINELAVGKENDSIFLKTNLISIDKASAAIYRDKFEKEEDLRLKKLYSKAIRELPIKLTIDSVSVKNTIIEYSEKLLKQYQAGLLTIKIIDGGITNVSNTYSSPERTVIIVDGIFMKETPFNANWSFDINNTDDQFKFIGHVGKLELSDMNVFLTPLLNAKVKGEVIASNFTINGNFDKSVINISQEYKDVHVILLNKKKKKKKLLSTVANVVIHHNSGKKGTLFHNGTTQATRDHTKSFFNYLAKNLINGVKVNFLKKNNTVTKEKKKKRN